MSLNGVEERMLIDGALVEAAGGRLYDNINPATEEILGRTADASAEDMDRAIAAARRAFDETGWSTDLALRKKCVEQLQAALKENREVLRPQIIGEVGAPIGLTYAVQQDMAIDDMGWDIGVAVDLRGNASCRSVISSESRAGAWWYTSRSAWWLRSRRGTSPSCSTSPRSSRR